MSMVRQLTLPIEVRDW